MKFFEKMKLNKILLIITIVLAIIAILSVSLFIVFKNKPKDIGMEEINKEEISAKNLFSVITVNMLTKEVKRDSKDTTFKDEFNIDAEKETLILSSEEELKNFFINTTFEIEFKEKTAYISNKFQTRKLIVELNDLNIKFNGTENNEKISDNIYILTYDSQKKTKAAYESLSKIQAIKNIEVDEVIKIKQISDESQTVYSANNESDNEEDRVFGVKAMGLDNYKNIIMENGNPTDIVVATIGYGAEINNSYFTGRISDKSFNFIKNTSEVYETIPQGSRILEVIQESTTHNVKIMPLMVVDEENYTTIACILKSLFYAKQNSDIICYELVHKKDNIIDSYLKEIFKENIPLCAVATADVNENENYPANNSTTIAVTSIDKSSKITNYSAKRKLY